MSNDVLVGRPFNITQYALLTHIVAHCTGHLAEELVFSSGDTHVYENQIKLFEGEQIHREPLDINPTVWIDPEVRNIDHLTAEDIKVQGYESHPSIRYPVAV